jgi:hypothetical protein
MARWERPLAFAGHGDGAVADCAGRGKLVLGTWQQIFHLECDVKPRDREIVVTVTGE